MWLTSTTCCNCEGNVIEAPLSEYDGVGATVDGNERPDWLQYDGSKHFVRCPRCSAKNIVIRSRAPDGKTVLTITRVIMEDE